MIPDDSGCESPIDDRGKTPEIDKTKPGDRTTGYESEEGDNREPNNQQKDQVSKGIRDSVFAAIEMGFEKESPNDVGNQLNPLKALGPETPKTIPKSQIPSDAAFNYKPSNSVKIPLSNEQSPINNITNATESNTSILRKSKPKTYGLLRESTFEEIEKDCEVKAEGKEFDQQDPLPLMLPSGPPKQKPKLPLPRKPPVDSSSSKVSSMPSSHTFTTSPAIISPMSDAANPSPYAASELSIGCSSDDIEDEDFASATPSYRNGHPYAYQSPTAANKLDTEQDLNDVSVQQPPEQAKQKPVPPERKPKRPSPRRISIDANSSELSSPATNMSSPISFTLPSPPDASSPMFEVPSPLLDSWGDGPPIPTRPNRKTRPSAPQKPGSTMMDLQSLSQFSITEYSDSSQAVTTVDNPPVPATRKKRSGTPKGHEGDNTQFETASFSSQPLDNSDSRIGTSNNMFAGSDHVPRDDSVPNNSDIASNQPTLDSSTASPPPLTNRG